MKTKNIYKAPSTKVRSLNTLQILAGSTPGSTTTDSSVENPSVGHSKSFFDRSGNTVRDNVWE